MKLVVVSHACVVGQNQLFYQRLAEISGWDITIIAPCNWRTQYHKKYNVQKHASFLGSLTTIKVYFPGSIIRHLYHVGVFGAIYRAQPDRIYIHNEGYALVTFQIMLFNKFFIKKPIAFYAAQNIVKKYPFLFRAIEHFNFSNSSMAFPVTDSAALCLRQKGFAGPSVTLPLGVCTSVSSPKIPDEAPYESPCRIIGYVGRLVPEKGVDDLLHALALLKETNWRCRIIGDGPQKDGLAALANELELGRVVKFVGYVDHGDVSDEIDDFSMLVLPSRTLSHWKEQFGRVIIEALAAGVPVIGSDSGEIPFLIRRLGGGLVVPEGDIDKLALAIDELLSNNEKRCHLGKIGRHNVQTHYTDTTIAATFSEQFLNSVRSKNHDLMLPRPLP